MAKHTPGPWLIGKRFICHSVIVDGSGNPVAETACHIRDDLSEARQQIDGANADLIAAAPELLAACEAVYQPLLDGSFYADYDRASALVGELRNVIAKAGGQS